MAAFTATATLKEVNVLRKSMGTRKNSLMEIKECSIMPNQVIWVLKRPSSKIGLLGENVPRKGREKPREGDLGLLRKIILNKVVEYIKLGRPMEIKKTIIFFRKAEDMMWIFSWLSMETGMRHCDSALFVMVHSKNSQSDDSVMEAREPLIRLYLTTNKLLMGVDLEEVHMVVIVRPPNMLHSIVQVIR